VSNAVKFTQTGSVHVRVAWKPAQEWLVLEVADTGIGFSKEAGRKLFERFIQADTSITRRYGGTGLGLSICRGLIDAMGGGLKWASEPGQGTTFTVTLPLEPSDVELEKTRATPVEFDASEARLRILAAEDHPTNQQVLRLILEPLGVDLQIVPDGQQAVEAFKAQPFDIILMDMQMPIMDGLTATQEIRALEVASQRDRTPIIMLTANALREHKEAATIAGADLHVAKPFTPQSLVGAIEALLSDEVEPQFEVQPHGEATSANL
jgi:two-component system, sensor histidine kinase